MELDVGGPLAFNVVIAPPPRVAITTVVPDAKAALVITQGPPGPTGPSGPSFTGTAWWYGEGPPDVVIGSKIGDMYMDTLTGTVYELEVG